MSVTAVGGRRKPERPTPGDGAVDPHITIRMEALREQGLRFQGVAAVLMKQGLTPSAERVKELLEVLQGSAEEITVSDESAFRTY